MKQKVSITIQLLVAFLVLIYTRPYELLPFLIPLRLTRVSMIGALLTSFSGNINRSFIWKERSFQFFVVLQIITLFLIPFGYWASNSWEFWSDSYVKTFIGFYLMVIVTNNFRVFNILLKTIFFCATFVALRVIHGYLIGNYIFIEGVKRVVGVSTLTSVDPNDLALVLAMAVPIGFYFIYSRKNVMKKIIYIGCVLCNVSAILFTGSRGGYLGLLFGLLFFFGFLYKKQKGKFIGMVFLLIIITAIFLPSEHKARFMSMFDKEDYSYSDVKYGRKAIWKRGVKAMGSLPLGIGIKNYSLAEGKQKQAKGIAGQWMVAHNSYLQVGVELGWVGLLFYMLFLISGFNNIFVAARVAQALKQKQAYICACALLGGLAAFMISSFFLSQAFYWNHYIFIALTVSLKRLLTMDPRWKKEVERIKKLKAKKRAEAYG